MNTQQSKIKALKERTDLVELIGRYVDLRRSGRQYSGCCPFHAERTPSFYVDPVKRAYYCHGCGKGGDAITFLQDVEEIPFAEAVRRLGCTDLGSVEPTPERGLSQGETLFPEPIIHVDPQKVLVAAANAEQTSLYRFLCRHFTPEQVRDVCSRYLVGACRYVNHQGGRAAALPYIDCRGQVVDVKLMHFHPLTGSRKDAPPLRRWADTQIEQSWFLAECKQSHMRAPWCCFGEHLLAASPRKPIAVVESEKTALIASLAFPAYVWLAVGGKNNLHRLPLQAIGSRSVTLFPDNDAFADWTAQALPHGLKVSPLVHDQCPGAHDDLADWMLRGI